MIYYKGFSTKGYLETGRSFSIQNVEAIEEDLLNELLTIKGERLEMPEFGTRIPLLVHEPNDTESAEILKEDVTTVIGGDPRVKLLACDVLARPDKNRLICIAKVEYLEFNVTKDLRIESAE